MKNDKAMATGAALCCATKGLLLATSLSCVMLVAPGIATAQEVLPFPPKPSGSSANLTMQDSVYSPLAAIRRLAADVPNIIIVLVDDVGPALTHHLWRRDQHTNT